MWKKKLVKQMVKKGQERSGKVKKGQEKSRSCSKMSLLVFAFNYIPFMIVCNLSSLKTCIPDNLEIGVPHFAKKNIEILSHK